VQPNAAKHVVPRQLTTAIKRSIEAQQSGWTRLMNIVVTKPLIAAIVA
jgi:hypothetical protein